MGEMEFVCRPNMALHMGFKDQKWSKGVHVTPQNIP